MKITTIIYNILASSNKKNQLRGIQSFNDLKAKPRTNGCAIAQAVSHWLPTAAARVQTRVYSHVGFAVDKVALGHVFSE
jgi:hypothetical protein